MRTLRPLFLFLLVFLVAVPTFAQDETPSDPPEGPYVADAAVALRVENREPVGAAETFPAGTERLVCFTDVRNAAGRTVVHAWIHEGTTRARVELEIGGDRWRTWSAKNLLPEWTGEWQVKVMTADGAVLETISFTVE